MSKNSAKSNYTQLMEWLPTLGRTYTPKKEQSSTKFSKADHYKSKGAYGNKGN
jgi:hypothetical protein